MKNTAKTIKATQQALLAIEQDEFEAFVNSPEPETAQDGAFQNQHERLAEQAFHLACLLDDVWTMPIKHIQALMHDDYHAPIHDILQEVVAAKVEARARRKAKEQQAITKAFSLEARARFIA